MKGFITLLFFGVLITCIASCTNSASDKTGKYPHTQEVFFLSKTIDNYFPTIHASIRCDHNRDSTLWDSRIEDLSLCKEGLGKWANHIWYCPYCSDYSTEEEYDSLITVILKQKEEDLMTNLVGKWDLWDERDVHNDYCLYFSSRLNTFVIEKKVSIHRESLFLNVKVVKNGWILSTRSGSYPESYLIDSKGNFTIFKSDISLKSKECNGIFSPELFDKYCNCSPIRDHELAPLSDEEIKILRNVSLKWIEVKAKQQELQDAQHKKDIFFVMNIENELDLIETKYDVNSFLQNIEKAAKIIKDETDINTKKELTAVLTKYQKKYFPIARKVFARSAKNEMCRDDIDVKYTNKTITFKSIDFYRNATIEDCYKQIQPYLRDLRFTKVSFYRGRSGTSIYYTINTFDEDESPCCYMFSQK